MVRIRACPESSRRELHGQTIRPSACLRSQLWIHSEFEAWISGWSQKGEFFQSTVNGNEIALHLRRKDSDYDL